MTERLYYSDSYTTEFSAQIVGRQTVGDRPALILDQTYFYPTGGGQPHDTGTINGATVVDVLALAPEDGGEKRLLHVLDREVAGDTVNCQIDWTRRFDHMQHHTGQHLLTQAFVQVADANTVGFHMSDASITIDLDTTGLAPDTVAEVEVLANRIVWENRPVTTRLIDPDDADEVRMRIMPDQLATDGLRVVEVEGFDSTACGGTHVARTGDIGLIKIIKLEKRGDNTRVEFRCGGRALRDYQLKNAVVGGLTATLTCGIDELEAAVERLREDLKQTQRDLRAVQKQMLGYETTALLAEAIPLPDYRIVKAAFDERDAKQLRILANSLVDQPRVIALLGTVVEGKGFILLARSGDVSQDMNALLQRVLPILGARGGGQPNSAQGGGVKADLQQVEMTLDEAERVLVNEG